MNRENVSSIDRLRGLPPLFRGTDLTVRFSWTSKTASQYLYLWKERGLIDSLGGHSDIFANRLSGSTPDWEAALGMAMPSGVIVGVEALRRAGWTTQIPSLATVAVNSRDRVFNGIRRFHVQSRPPKWFGAVADGIERQSAGLPMLRPAWALADMLATEGWGACGLQPDDLDLSQATPQDATDWRAACEAFKVQGLQALELVGEAEKCAALQGLTGLSPFKASKLY